EFVRRERRSSLAAETEYAFRHILVRDVAYGQIPRGDRGERHALAAAWIESLGRAADHAELLAQHYLSAIELARAAGRPTDSYADRARAALREAGDRASGLNAFAPAARYYRAALDLTPPDDPDRPILLFRCGRALRVSEESGSDLLAVAEAALRADGDLETAAEAAVLQGELAWFAGDGEGATRHLARAADLVDGLQPSASKAFVLSDLSRFHMLAARSEEAIEIGRQALEIAESLGLDELRAHALNNIGSARCAIEDMEGVADLESALQIATSINSPEAARVMNNLGGIVEGLGDRKRAWQLWRDGLAWARELGNVPVARFISGVIPTIDYSEGAWDESLHQLDAFILEAEAGGGHAQEPVCRVFRGRIRFARDDIVGALEDAESGLAAGRRIGDPQSLIPTLGFMAWLLIELEREREANELIDEMFQYPNAGANSGPDLALGMLKLGRRDVDRLAATSAAGPWRDMFALIAAAKLPDAVAVSEELGMRPASALLRLRAAPRLVEEGRSDEARSYLAAALEFWRSVGATRFIREAEHALARLDSAKPTPERAARH
ncbi:MAG: hypothetical protein M3R57_12640, partial [Chloroflexota bacterium]|nr:hypothetical protein [Chloroflexota bacterium]